jgi:hypothetical protein
VTTLLFGKPQSRPNELLYMVTTTSIPYMYHVPAILGTPTGIAYWFRYLTRYLHPNLRERGTDRIPTRGLLYLRDENSQRKLCYPLRWFRVLWCEKSEAITFLNLEMRPLVPYRTARAPLDDSTPAPDGVDEGSWRLLSEHVAAYRRRMQRSESQDSVKVPAAPIGVDPTIWAQFTAYSLARHAVEARPAPFTVAIPQSGAPGITPWIDLKPDGDDGLLWLNLGTQGENCSDQDDARRWRDMLPAFAAVDQVNTTPFFFLGGITSVANPRVRRPRRIGRGTGLHARGIPVKPFEAYRLRIDQITPHAFCKDAPTMKPFRLTISGSDTGVRPTVKDVEIDGPYGHYELSFDVDPARAGTYALLRLSSKGLELPASAYKDANKVRPPDIVVPLIIEKRWMRSVLWGALAFACIIGFVSVGQWMPAAGLHPEGTGGTLVQALLFGLAIFFGNKAGVGDFARSVGQRV